MIVGVKDRDGIVCLVDLEYLPQINVMEDEIDIYPNRGQDIALVGEEARFFLDSYLRYYGEELRLSPKAALEFEPG